MDTTMTALRQNLVDQLRAIILAALGPSDQSLLPFIPRPVKLLFALVFILNWRSWPFVWHIRVLKPVLDIGFADFWNNRILGRRRQWIDDRSCAGADPFELVSIKKCYAGIDDCDYNLHLSNSAYAKSVDTTRMKAATEIFGPVLGEGTWIALAGSQYHFIREIPMGTHYEIHSTFGGWEDKWFYLVHTFISHPKSKKTRGPINATITTPSTPSVLDSPPPEQVTPKEPYKAPLTVPKFLLRKPLPEGAVVHCITVSLYCFKIGRITIPPSVLFVASGFGDPAKNRWTRIQDLRFSKSGNQLPKMLKGGWRTDEVEGWEKSSRGEWSSFWELAEFEEKRADLMRDIFGGFYESLQALKAIPV